MGVGRALAALGIGLLADTVESDQLDVKVRRSSSGIPLPPFLPPLVPFPLGPGRCKAQARVPPATRSHQIVETEQKTADEVKNGFRRKMTERAESCFFADQIDRTESNVLIRSPCPWRDNSFLRGFFPPELTLDNFQPQPFPR